MRDVGGRPTDYDPKHVTEMLEYFTGWEEYTEAVEEFSSNGKTTKVIKQKPNKPPTLGKYAIKIGVHRKTLQEWAAANAEFQNTYDACKQIQEEFLCDKGLLGEYNSNITKFMLVNHTEMRDKTEQTIDASVKTESVEDYLKRIDKEKQKE
jgi:hypothetical protein